MPKNTQPIALEPIHRLLLSSSALRISKKASDVVRNHIEKKAISKAKKIVELSQHAQRTTIMKKDVQLGFERK